MNRKYHNKKVIYDGIKFDSKKEARRYSELKLMEKAKIIDELELQKVFELQPKYINNKGEHIRAITYRADFFYYDKEKKKYIVEDVKPSATYKTDVYRIKRKMLEYVYPNLTIDEVY
jgi:hypothetical protein